MKPTDEERRDVASELRNLADCYKKTPAWSVLVCGELPAPLDDALMVCGVRGAAYATEICERLADLIEPETERTCRAVARYRDNDSSPWRYYVCSECGEELRYRDVVTDYGEESCEMLPYCAGCGAKVVVE